MLCFLIAGPDSPRMTADSMTDDHMTDDYMTDDYQKDPYVTTWLSKEKARQLMRYHGTNGIMITADKVYIKRDERWICVYRDPSSLPGKDHRSVSPESAMRVGRDNS